MPGMPLLENPASPAPYDSGVDTMLLQSLDQELQAFNVRASFVGDTSSSDRSSRTLSEPSDEILAQLFSHMSVEQKAPPSADSFSRLVNGTPLQAEPPLVHGHNDGQHNDADADADNDDDDDADDMDMMAERRAASLKEMLGTERSYVRGLKRLCETFLYPLRSGSNQRQGLLNNVRQGLISVRGTLKRDRQASLPAITPGRPVDAVQTRAHVAISNADLNMLFGNVETILAMHKRAQRMMEERYRDWSDDVPLSDIYKYLLTTMPQYQVYVENFTHACATLQRLTSQSKDFRRFVKQQDDSSLDSTNLKAYLNLPLRRIGRYFNHFNQQLAHMPPSHPDYAAMSALLKEFSRASTMIAASVTATERRLQLSDLEQLITGLPRWTSGKHQLIYAEKLHHFTMVGEGSQRVTHFVMLLDDRIIWALETGPDRYVFKGQLMLLEAFVTDLADTAFYAHAFRVVSGDGNEAVF
ncbi:Dbl homology domain-containing protein [Syncephalis pseudoplumigaleata]|uniref:Dbl homology domain-containing protein n=1 Tax=Syncephalis pseudoplumigaleata TaxID=1712513 RepID=A0A4V1J1R9_9FUNG|nr:Dbl homology domain-containing protein [Syncephalis pseudoplumigaleata]|eukprot:RKP26019.1 Dbl homology domain-containing protein [Syncephalis pseudoplumigaleata]